MTLSQRVQTVSRPQPCGGCGQQLRWRVYTSYTTCMADSHQVMATRHSVQVLLKDLHQHLSHPQPGIAGHLSPPEDLHNQTSVQWQTVSEMDQLVLLMTALMPVEKIHNINVFHEQKSIQDMFNNNVCRGMALNAIYFIGIAILYTHLRARVYRL